MNVYLASAVPFARDKTPIPAFEEIARTDRFGIHQLTTNPAAADIILFVDLHQHIDWTLSNIRNHPLTRKYREKVLVYDERDRPWCSMPGIYVSMPKAGFDEGKQRPYSYYTIGNKCLELSSSQTPDLLFSFLGSRSHKIRKHILGLSHPRACIEDTSSVNFFDFSETRNETRIKEQKKRFAEVVTRSKFVICPRGKGTSSIRLYEVMAAGRVPVIISDAWVSPKGPDWHRCSLRIAEAEIAKIPQILESEEANFENMMVNARNTYEEWFAPDVMFHRLIEQCQDLLQIGATTRRQRPNWLDSQYRYCGICAAGEYAKSLAHIKRLVRRRGYA